MTFKTLSEPGSVFEFAVLHRPFESLGTALVFQDLNPVKPVFDVVSSYKDPRLVDFAWLVQRGFYLGLEHIIKAACNPLSMAELAVRVLVIIQHLIFVPD